ncbi:HAD hydrolase-like protein, partial [Escherichia coli]
MVKQAILFDIDGTLVDSNDAHVSAWRDAFRQHDYDFD